MAVRLPLVQVDGEIQELQAGDNIDTAADTITRTFTATVVAGAVLYVDGNGSVDQAQANAEGTSQVIGLAKAAVTIGNPGDVSTDGTVTLTTGEWDVITGEAGGLTFDNKYYLSDAAAGRLLQEDNLAGLGAGEYVVEVGIGLSTTELQMRIRRRILLG